MRKRRVLKVGKGPKREKESFPKLGKTENGKNKMSQTWDASPDLRLGCQRPTTLLTEELEARNTKQ